MSELFCEKMAERLLGGDSGASEESPKPRQSLYGFKALNQEFFSPRQAASLLLFSDQTIWRWLRQGRIPSLKIGRYYRIPLNELIDLAKNGNILIRQNLMNQANYAASKFSK